MIVIGLCCDDVTLCQTVAHSLETRHADVVTAPSVASWLYELQPVVEETPALAVVLNIYDNTDANTLRKAGGVIIHLARSTRVEAMDVVEGDYLLVCGNGAACYERFQDTLTDIERDLACN